MGKHFGELGVHIRGVLYYVLSPHETKKFGNPWLKGCYNVIDRTRQSIFRVVPIFIIGYGIYAAVEAKHKEMSRKDPKIYLDEDRVDPTLDDKEADAQRIRTCYRFEEPRPKCEVDWVVEKYRCKPGEEPDPEIIAFLQKRLNFADDLAYFQAEDDAVQARKDTWKAADRELRARLKEERPKEPDCC